MYVLCIAFRYLLSFGFYLTLLLLSLCFVVVAAAAVTHECRVTESRWVRLLYVVAAAVVVAMFCSMLSFG